MLNPLWVLAFFSVFAGFVGLPQVWGDLIGINDSNSLATTSWRRYLAVGEPHNDRPQPPKYWMAALQRLQLHWPWVRHWRGWMYIRRIRACPATLAEKLSGLYRMLLNKYYVDEIYDAAIVRPLVAFSDRVLFRIIDTRLIDGIWQSTEPHDRNPRFCTANGLKYAHSGFAQSYVFLMIVGAVAIVGYLIR